MWEKAWWIDIQQNCLKSGYYAFKYFSFKPISSTNPCDKKCNTVIEYYYSFSALLDKINCIIFFHSSNWGRESFNYLWIKAI
jgi:hypothetical protein